MTIGDERKQLWNLLLHLSKECQCMRQLKRIHARLLRHHVSGPFILAKLLLFAVVSPRGNLHYATLLFYHHHSDIFACSSTTAFFYNTLIRGYANTSSPSFSLSLFVSMRRLRVPPDHFTFTFLLKAQARSPVSSPNDNASIHAQILKHGCLGSHETHIHVHNALIHLYASVALPHAARQLLYEMPLTPDAVSWSGLLNAHLCAGDTDTARTIFDETIPAGKRDVVSWTAMISGYVKSGRPRDALQLFLEMPMSPDEVTMVALVTACATARDLEAGEKLHRYAEERGFNWMVALRNALIDMYAKCGCLWRARQLFDQMEEENRSLVTWNSMAWAHAAHGDVDGAIHLFRRMSSSREGRQLNPDGVTNLAVLSACVHAGRVDEGRKLFSEMTAMGAKIGVEHYGCMVDLLGRAGMLDAAWDLVEGMPFVRNEKIWGALLGGCRIHGDLKMGEKAAAKLMKLSPEKGGYHILLSAIYVEAGRPVDAAMIRRSIDRRKATKTAGLSQNSGSSVKHFGLTAAPTDVNEGDPLHLPPNG